MEKTNEPYLLRAYKLDGNGLGTPISEEIALKLNKKELTWLHLHADKPETKSLLKKLGLDPIIITALTEEDTRPRLNEFDKGSMIILRGVNLNENAEAEDMVSIRIYVEKNRIISVRKRQLKAVFDIGDNLLKGKGPKTSGEFIRTLALFLCERMEPTFTELEEQTDNIEEKVMEEPDIKLRSLIVDIRKQAIKFRRYLAPQRDVLARLRTLDQDWLSAIDKKYIQEAFDRITRYVEDLDAIRERTQIVQDELGNYLSDKLNKNMYVLSIVAAIFLPLGFLTGLLGINVGGIPGAEDSDAFMMFIYILIAVVIIQVIIFKKMRWF